MIKRWMMVIGTAALLGGCGQQGDSPVEQTQTQTMTQSAAVREVDFAQVVRGGRLYQQNCAECHGVNGEGAPNWRQRDPDGMFPAPPLNGSGHAWHHPKRMLQYVIANGSPGGQGRMPAWKGKLTEAEIDDIIAWFMSKWPDEVYQSWYLTDQRAMSGG
jgi:mono/diheme cytochrome c family protein